LFVIWYSPNRYNNPFRLLFSPSTSTTASGLIIKDVAFVGTLQDVTNYNSFSITTLVKLLQLLQPNVFKLKVKVSTLRRWSQLPASNRGHWKHIE
jgi:hypothetical protein